MSDQVLKASSTGHEISDLADALVGWFDADGTYVIALSGGVDSAVVARAASLSRSSCSAATACGPSLSRREREDAERIVAAVGIPHRWIDAGEIGVAGYRENGPRRCYHCKHQLYTVLHQIYPRATVVAGTNLDDLDDYRPGLAAARKLHVRAPLAELGIDKRQVRELAEFWQLPVADKPASPCLASRIAYGVEVTEQRLLRIDRAEQIVRSLGVPDCRVRLHAGEVARIEVPADSLSMLLEPKNRERLVEQLQQLGFAFVTVDLEPLRSGSLNSLVSISSLRTV